MPRHRNCSFMVCGDTATMVPRLALLSSFPLLTLRVLLATGGCSGPTLAGGEAQLAAIGLLAFAAVAQLAPAFFGGLFWRRATAQGAITIAGGGDTAAAKGKPAAAKAKPKAASQNC